MNTDARGEPDYRRIIEGRCPTCDGPLERRENDGWCYPCNCGWAYKTTGHGTADLTLTIEPNAVELNAALARSARFVSRGHRVAFTREL